MRVSIILAATAWLLVPTGCALTQSGTVWKVDHWDRTVAIGDAIYHVTDGTKLFGARGNSIVLDAVPSAADPRIGVRYLARAEVDFRAHQEGGRLVLDELWLRPRRAPGTRSRPTAF